MYTGDFIHAYEGMAKDRLKYLEIPHPDELIFGQRRIKRQADALTDEWVQKYLAMYEDKERMVWFIG